jgi:hypothetical protein
MRERPLFTLLKDKENTSILDKQENEQIRLSQSTEKHEAK